jgi:ZIP family zinc transporter
MQPTLEVIVLTFAAGAAIAAGGFVARIERIRPKWLEQEFRHSVIAFGGGALLSAVALVLVPEGSHTLSPPLVAVSLAFGGIAFMGLDILLVKRRTPASQLAAVVSDFVPEALALGAAVASGEQTGPLLALLIGLQNLPEGFNAYRELRERAGVRPGKILAVFSVMAFLGPLAGLAGLYVLSRYPALVSAVMLFAAGGILYLTFQDIAPQARLEKHWAPPLGAVAGFLLGLIGQMLLEHP